MDQLPALEPDEPEPEAPEINTIVEAESDTEADDIFVKPIALEIKEVKPPKKKEKKKKELSEKQRLHLIKARQSSATKANKARKIKQEITDRVTAEMSATVKPPPRPNTPVNIPVTQDTEEQDFFKFMNRMDKYNDFKAFMKEKNKPVPTPTAPPAPAAPAPPPKRNINNLMKPPVNPYDNMFNWA
jgi:hypothetical protein